MNEKIYRLGLLTCFILVMAGLGIVIWQQSELIKKMNIREKTSSTTQSEAASRTQTVTSASPSQNPAQEVNRLDVRGTSLTLIQRCLDGVQPTRLQQAGSDGEMHEGLPFCVGRNQLVVLHNGIETAIDEQAVTTPETAPVLLDAALLRNATSSSRTVLISYAPEPCSTANDCGVGMPNYHVRFAYDIQTNTVRSLKNFPESGAGPIWNGSMNKALFIPVTCGGAGCLEAPLFGYDLTIDRFAENLTQERATLPESSGERPRDVQGRPINRWGKVEWTSDTAFHAEIISPSGTRQWIIGQF